MDEEQIPRPAGEYAIVEEWRPIFNYEGLYEVSSLGRVRRVGRSHQSGNGRGGGQELDEYCHSVLLMAAILRSIYGERVRSSDFLSMFLLRGPFVANRRPAMK